MKPHTTLYWNRTPGRFCSKETGQTILVDTNFGPKFTGSVREWYETLFETMVDLRERLHKSATEELGTCNPYRVTVDCDPDVMCIVESNRRSSSDRSSKRTGRSPAGR